MTKSGGSTPVPTLAAMSSSSETAFSTVAAAVAWGTLLFFSCSSLASSSAEAAAEGGTDTGVRTSKPYAAYFHSVRHRVGVHFNESCNFMAT